MNCSHFDREEKELKDLTLKYKRDDIRPEDKTLSELKKPYRVINLKLNSLCWWFDIYPLFIWLDFRTKRSPHIVCSTLLGYSIPSPLQTPVGSMKYWTASYWDITSRMALFPHWTELSDYLKDEDVDKLAMISSMRNL